MSPSSLVNADSLDRNETLPDLFYLSPNMLGLFAFPKQHHVLRRAAYIFKSSLDKFASFFCCFCGYNCSICVIKSDYEANSGF